MGAILGAILDLGLGVLLLVGGALFVVEGGVAAARRMGVSSMLVGLTIVAFGTSAPELAVSLSAHVRGAADVVTGNIVGSNILNVHIVLGLSALMAPVAVQHVTLRRDIPMVAVSSLGVWLLASDGEIPRAEGMLMLLAGLGFMWMIYRADRIDWAPEEVKRANRLDRYPIVVSFLAVLLGLGGLVMGGRSIVSGGVALAEAAGLSERVIGLTVVALGTSLPELATTLVAAWKREIELAVGNIVGSNIFNLLIVLGITALYAPLPIARSIIFVDMPFMILAAILLLQLARRGNQVGRTRGAILVSVYIGYTVLVLTGAFEHFA